MRISTRPHFGLFIRTALFCLGAALLLSSCAKKPQDAIIGKWKVDENQSTVEYRKDGTMVTSQDGKDIMGKYEFVDNTHLKLESTELQGGNTVIMRFSCELAIHGDKAEISTTLGSNPPVKRTLHYTRVK
jgi:hypothetical protein